MIQGTQKQNRTHLGLFFFLIKNEVITPNIKKKKFPSNSEIFTNGNTQSAFSLSLCPSMSTKNNRVKGSEAN